MKQLCAIVAATALAFAAPLSAQTTVVYGSGTPFTSAGPADAVDPSCALSVNTWCARNVRNNASVGQTTARPRNGNGSLAFSSPNSSGKADFEYYFANSFKLGTLTGLGYDYFRDGSSTVAGHLVPSLRILIEQDGLFGALIYEPVYNGQPTAPVNAWTSVAITGSTNMWLSQFSCGIQEQYDITLSTWESATGSPKKCGTGNFNSNANVVGLSTGVGSGWNGTFDGAVDNVTYRTAGMEQSRVFNFEVASTTVPEPSTYALMGAGLAAMGIAARRRRNRSTV
jgi:hypothetical protein